MFFSFKYRIYIRKDKNIKNYSFDRTAVKTSENNPQKCKRLMLRKDHVRRANAIGPTFSDRKGYQKLGSIT